MTACPTPRPIPEHRLDPLGAPAQPARRGLGRRPGDRRRVRRHIHGACAREHKAHGSMRRRRRRGRRHSGRLGWRVTGRRGTRGDTRRRRPPAARSRAAPAAGTREPANPLTLARRATLPRWSGPSATMAGVARLLVLGAGPAQLGVLAAARAARPDRRRRRPRPVGAGVPLRRPPRDRLDRGRAGDRAARPRRGGRRRDRARAPTTRSRSRRASPSGSACRTRSRRRPRRSRSRGSSSASGSRRRASRSRARSSAARSQR